MRLIGRVIRWNAGAAGALCISAALGGCVWSTDITAAREHPAVKGNRYAVPGAVFVVQTPISMSVNASTAGLVLYPQFHGQDITNCNASDLKQMQVGGYLTPGDTVRVERVYWIRHFDVGDHLEIRGRVLSGSLKGTLVDLESAQDDKYLRPVGQAQRDVGDTGVKSNAGIGGSPEWR